LVASSNRSCTDTFRSNVYVNPQPVAGFTTVDTGFCLRGNEVKFTNISQITSGTVRSQWEFGDGRSSSGTDPVNKYSAAGVYKVKLVVISNLGCNDSIQKNLTLYPNPEAGFRLNSVKQCLNQNKVDVIDTTKVKGGAYNFVWNMGDGKIGSGTSYSHKYDTTGEYRIYLAAISEKGCTDTAFATVSVLPNPKAKFDVNDSIQCLGTNDFVFDNRTTLSFGKFITRWNYGDGTVKESLNGRFTYVNPGLYKVSQIVISSESCADTARRDIFVTEQPTVSFMLNKAEQCQKYNLFEADNTSV
jgi:PKD repeat protein